MPHQEHFAPDDGESRHHALPDPLSSPQLRVDALAEDTGFASYYRGEPWQDVWRRGGEPADHNEARFGRAVTTLFRTILVFANKLIHINPMELTGTYYHKFWAILALKELRNIRDTSEDASRRIITELVTRKILTPTEAFQASGYSRSSIYSWVRAKKEQPTVEEPATKPEPQPVAAAIVTSTLGVLAGKRNDGKPPWTFIAGEIEPGESPADAAIREVKEEAGLQVAVSHVIGRRVHPKTGRTMIYLACQPTDGTDVHVGDPEELSEVRWLSLTEADQLLTGMYEPVHKHLATMIG